MYGLKQSSRQWYLKFHQAILEIGFDTSPLDHCVYIWRCYNELTILSLYVDDILLVGNSPNMMIKTKSFQVSRFEMKDMSPSTYVLGIKIIRDINTKLLYLDQENYLEKVLNKFNIAESKTLSTLVSKGTILSKKMCPKDKEEQEFMENVPYA